MVRSGDTDGDLQAVPPPARDDASAPTPRPVDDVGSWQVYAEVPSPELGALTRRTIAALAHRSDPAALAELRALYVGLGATLREAEADRR